MAISDLFIQITCRSSSFKLIKEVKWHIPSDFYIPVTDFMR